MLKVKTSLIRLPWARTPLMADQARIANEDAKAFAADLRSQCRHDRCDEHPDEDSTVVVVAMWNGHSRVRKDDFCCDAHADKYDLNLELAPKRRVSSKHFMHQATATR
ncbi:MAG: hypothetical protein IPM46_07300 [Flavobacteriales bacterium]|nr:hypothetical protein [Flavobacteriales bacterium]